MPTPLEIINAQRQPRAVTVYSPGRAVPMRQPRPVPMPRRVLPTSGPEARAAGVRGPGVDWAGLADAVTNSPSAQKAREKAAQKEAEDEAWDNTPFYKKGLGMVLGNPITRAGLVPLNYLQTLGRGVTLGIEEVAEKTGIDDVPTWMKVAGMFTPAMPLAALSTVSGLVDEERTEADKRSNWEKLLSPETDYGFGQLLDKDNPAWLNNTLGFAGDVLLDPLTYASFGATKAAGAIPKGAKLAKAAKLTTEADDLLEAGRVAARAGDMGEAAKLGREVAAKRAMAKQLGIDAEKISTRNVPIRQGRRARESFMAELSQHNPDLLVSHADEIARGAQRGFNTIDDPFLREALGLQAPGARWFGQPLPYSGRAVRRGAKMGGGVRAGLNKVPGLEPTLAKFTPRGLEEASGVLSRGKKGNVLEAATMVRIQNLLRQGTAQMEGQGNRELVQLVRQLKGMGGEQELRKLFRQAEVDAKPNILNDFFGKKLPELYETIAGRGMDVTRNADTYIPHMMNAPWKRFLRNLKDPQLVEDLGFVGDDLLEGSQYLEKSRKLQPDKIGTPTDIDLAGRTITLTDGTVEELNSELSRVFPEFKGKAYMDDPVKIGEAYISSVARQAGRDKAMDALAESANPLVRDVTGELLESVKVRNEWGRRNPLAEMVRKGYTKGQRLVPVKPKGDMPTTPFDDMLAMTKHKVDSKAQRDLIQGKVGKQFITDVAADTIETRKGLADKLKTLRKTLMDGLKKKETDATSQIRGINNALKGLDDEIKKVGNLTTESVDDIVGLQTTVDAAILDTKSEIRKIRDRYGKKIPRDQAAIERELQKVLKDLDDKAKALEAKYARGTAEIKAEALERRKALEDPVKQAAEELERAKAEVGPSPVGKDRVQAANVTVRTAFASEDAFEEARQLYFEALNVLRDNNIPLQRTISGRFTPESADVVQRAVHDMRKAKAAVPETPGAVAAAPAAPQVPPLSREDQLRQAMGTTQAPAPAVAQRTINDPDVLPIWNALSTDEQDAINKAVKDRAWDDTHNKRPQVPQEVMTAEEMERRGLLPPKAEAAPPAAAAPEATAPTPRPAVQGTEAERAKQGLKTTRKMVKSAEARLGEATTALNEAKAANAFPEQIRKLEYAVKTQQDRLKEARQFLADAEARVAALPVATGAIEIPEEVAQARTVTKPAPAAAPPAAPKPSPKLVKVESGFYASEDGWAALKTDEGWHVSKEGEVEDFGFHPTLAEARQEIERQQAAAAPPPASASARAEEIIEPPVQEPPVPEPGAPTPPPAPGTVRLYRGNALAPEPGPGLPGWMEGQPEIVARGAVEGRWFHTDPTVAGTYPTNRDPGVGNRITYVDVPAADLAKYQQFDEATRALSKDPTREAVLPPEIAAQAQEYIPGAAAVEPPARVPEVVVQRSYRQGKDGSPKANGWNVIIDGEWSQTYRTKKEAEIQARLLRGDPAQWKTVDFKGRDVEVGPEGWTVESFEGARPPASSMPGYLPRGNEGPRLPLSETDIFVPRKSKKVGPKRYRTPLEGPRPLRYMATHPTDTSMKSRSFATAAEAKLAVEEMLGARRVAPETPAEFAVRAEKGMSGPTVKATTITNQRGPLPVNVTPEEAAANIAQSKRRVTRPSTPEERHIPGPRYPEDFEPTEAGEWVEGLRPPEQARNEPVQQYLTDYDAWKAMEDRADDASLTQAERNKARRTAKSMGGAFTQKNGKHYNRYAAEQIIAEDAAHETAVKYDLKVTAAQQKLDREIKRADDQVEAMVYTKHHNPVTGEDDYTRLATGSMEGFGEGVEREWRRIEPPERGEVVTGTREMPPEVERTRREYSPEQRAADRAFIEGEENAATWMPDTRKDFNDLTRQAESIKLQLDNSARNQDEIARLQKAADAEYTDAVKAADEAVLEAKRNEIRRKPHEDSQPGAQQAYDEARSLTRAAVDNQTEVRQSWMEADRALRTKLAEREEYLKARAELAVAESRIYHYREGVTGDRIVANIRAGKPQLKGDIDSEGTKLVQRMQKALLDVEDWDRAGYTHLTDNEVHQLTGQAVAIDTQRRKLIEMIAPQKVAQSADVLPIPGRDPRFFNDRVFGEKPPPTVVPPMTGTGRDALTERAFAESLEPTQPGPARTTWSLDDEKGLQATRGVGTGRQPYKPGKETAAIGKLESEAAVREAQDIANVPEYQTEMQNLRNEAKAKTAAAEIDKVASEAALRAEKDEALLPLTDKIETFATVQKALHDKEKIIPMRAAAVEQRAAVVKASVSAKADLVRIADEIEAVAKQNPDLLDTDLATLEALLHDLRKEATRVNEADLSSQQVQKLIDRLARGKTKDIDVMLTTVGEGWKMLYESNVGRPILKEGDTIVQADLHRMFTNLYEIKKEPVWFGRALNAFTNLFKTYATLSPGFHVRNALSAIFMNTTDGVPLKLQYQAAGVWREYMKAENPSAWLKTQPQKIRDAFAAAHSSGAGGRFAEAGFGEQEFSGRYLDWMERLQRNKFTRWSARAGQRVEGSVRLAMAMHSMQLGESVEDAVQRINRIHFDYGEVSRLDENMKRVVPFWTFMSRNMPMQVSQMWTHPQVYTTYERFKANFRAEDEEYTPEYWTKAGSWNTGLKLPSFIPEKFGGGLPIYLQPDLGYTRLAADIKDYEDFLAWKRPGAVLSQGNPLFTAPGEFAFRKDIFTGQSFEEDETVPMGGPLGIGVKALAYATAQTKGGEVDAAFANFVRAINPLQDRASRLAPQLSGGNEQDIARQIESWLRTMGGVPARTLTPKQQDNEFYRRYYDQLNALKQQQEREQRKLAG